VKKRKSGVPGEADALRKEQEAMQDEDKTKGQLMDELMELRRQVAELKASRHMRERLGIQRGSRLGEILMEMDYVTASQLERSLARQEEVDVPNRRRIGEIMLESDIITEEEMHSALEVQEFRQKYDRPILGNG
jgi:hypothetical protein